MMAPGPLVLGQEFASLPKPVELVPPLLRLGLEEGPKLFRFRVGVQAGVLQGLKKADGRSLFDVVLALDMEALDNIEDEGKGGRVRLLKHSDEVAGESGKRQVVREIGVLPPLPQELIPAWLEGWARLEKERHHLVF